MDSLTQIVLGGAVGELTLGKKVGNRAILWGAIGGTIPDLDVFFSWLGSDFVGRMEVHRGFSHSILFSLLLAPILGWIISLLYRKRKEVSWKDWTKLAFWTLFTHPILDCHTTYGTQFFWPFEYRIAFQNIFVVDPFYTIPFMICLIAVMRHRRASAKRKYYNRLGLVLSSSYLALTFLLKTVAYYRFERNLREAGVDVLEIDTNPTPFQCLMWTGTAETADAYYYGITSMLDSDTQVEFGIVKKNHELLGPMAEDDQVQRLIALARGWWVLTPAENGVYLFDLRYGMFDPKMKIEELPFGYHIYEKDGAIKIENRKPPPFDMGDALGKTMKRAMGN